MRILGLKTSKGTFDPSRARHFWQAVFWLARNSKSMWNTTISLFNIVVMFIQVSPDPRGKGEGMYFLWVTNYLALWFTALECLTAITARGRVSQARFVQRSVSTNTLCPDSWLGCHRQTADPTSGWSNNWTKNHLPALKTSNSIVWGLENRGLTVSVFWWKSVKFEKINRILELIQHLELWI